MRAFNYERQTMQHSGSRTCCAELDQSGFITNNVDPTDKHSDLAHQHGRTLYAELVPY